MCSQNAMSVLASELNQTKITQHLKDEHRRTQRLMASVAPDSWLGLYYGYDIVFLKWRSHASAFIHPPMVNLGCVQCSVFKYTIALMAKVAVEMIYLTLYGALIEILLNSKCQHYSAIGGHTNTVLLL